MTTRLRLDSTKRSDATVLFLIFMSGIVIHIVLLMTVFNYDRALGIYDDELRYYSIARSLFNGTGRRIRNIPVNFQKIGMSLLMMPFFAVKDVILRLKLMAGVNIVIMNLSVIFVWLICSELKLSKRAKYFISFLTAIWPDMTYSFTFMSEPLYWPMSAMFFWLWLVNERKQSFAISAGLGLFCYIIYLTKEVALAFMIALAAFEVIYPVLQCLLQEGHERRKLREFYSSMRFMLMLTLMVVFGLCYAAMKMTFFRGLGNSYNQTSIQAIMSEYNIMYLIYAFFYYIAAILVASLVVPAVYPVANFRRMNEEGRKFFCYIILFGLVITTTIAYTISVREDLGDITPAIHLRYYGSFFVMMIIAFFASMENVDADEIARTHLRSGVMLTFAVMYVCFMFRGVRFLSSADQYILLWYTYMGIWTLSNAYPPVMLPPEGKNLIFYPSAIIGNIILVMIATLFHQVYARRGKKAALGVFGFVLVVSSVLLNIYAWRSTMPNYIMPSPQIAGEMVMIAEYFRDKETANLLYLNHELGSQPHDFKSRYVDTYIDHKRTYVINYEQFTGGIPDGGTVDVSNITLEGENMPEVYDKFEGIDYILLEHQDSEGHLRLADVELVLEGERFMLYKNLNRNVLKFEG